MAIPYSPEQFHILLSILHHLVGLVALGSPFSLKSSNALLITVSLPYLMVIDEELISLLECALSRLHLSRQRHTIFYIRRLGI